MNEIAGGHVIVTVNRRLDENEVAAIAAAFAADSSGTGQVLEGPGGLALSFDGAIPREQVRDEACAAIPAELDPDARSVYYYDRENRMVRC